MDTLELKGKIDLSVVTDSAEEITKLCKPLFQQLGVTFFADICVSRDDTAYCLSNDVKWNERFYDKYFFKKVLPLEYNPKQCLDQVLVMRAIDRPGTQPLLDDARNYDVSHGIVIVCQGKQSCNFYHLFTHADNIGAENVFLNNIRLLKKFILFYRNQADKIIKVAKQHPVFIPDTQYNILSLAERYSTSKNILESDYYFTDGIMLDDVYISSRELECLKWLSFGKNYKEISRILRVSPRTVERHLQTIKDKLGCYTDTFLIKRAAELYLI